MHIPSDTLPPVHDLAVLAEPGRVAIVACGADETRSLLVLPASLASAPSVSRLLQRVIGARRPRRVLVSRIGTAPERARLIELIERVEDVAESAGVEVVHLPDLARVVASRMNGTALEEVDEHDEAYDDA